MIIRMTIRDGRRAARSTIVGNSIGIFAWAAMSALGVSALILASQVAYDVLRLGGAIVLVVLGIRTIFAGRKSRATATDQPLTPRATGSGWRIGLLTGITNPKLVLLGLVWVISVTRRASSWVTRS
jgi:threonine/homoserine/homoserine lactone efflux protein